MKKDAAELLPFLWSLTIVQLKRLMIIVSLADNDDIDTRSKAVAALYEHLTGGEVAEEEEADAVTSDSSEVLRPPPREKSPSCCVFCVCVVYRVVSMFVYRFVCVFF